MDPRNIEALSRRLRDGSTRRAGLKAALAVLFGAGVAAAGDGRHAAAKKRCRPKCGAGQRCERGACVCTEGAVCGATCCRIGQICRDGQCVELPGPGQCAALGDACKRTGIPCCAGTVCASGQGGQDDIACYRPAGAACTATAECVFDSQCTGGVCVANEHPNDGGGSAGCVATGGTASRDGAFEVRTFTTVGNATLTFEGPCAEVRYLVVGGGGSGGSAGSEGNGGGAGGAVVTGTAPFPAGPVTIAVGRGGAITGGDPSSLGTITAAGGNAGGTGTGTRGGQGGSQGTNAGGSGGADSFSDGGFGGGGGGAGSGGNGLDGGAGTVDGGPGGNGGPGTSSDIVSAGTNVIYGAGGGGGGGAGTQGGLGGAGGASSAGAGGAAGNPGTSGAANTGGGGGGAGGANSAPQPGDGGSGVVIVRYRVA